MAALSHCRSPEIEGGKIERESGQGKVGDEGGSAGHKPVTLQTEQ